MTAFFISILIRGNLVTVGLDLAQGKASNYNSEMLVRYAKIKSCVKSNSACCELDSLKYKPASIFNFDLSKDEINWINKGEAAYYEMQSIKLKNIE